MSETSDTIWEKIVADVEREAAAEPMLGSFLHATVLNHSTLEDALSFHLASKLNGPTIHAMSIREVIDTALREDENIAQAVREDLESVISRDPACRGYYLPFLYFKGFQVLQSYRVAHWLWNQGREALALHFQSRVSELYAVDIHPAARIGKGILMDHATGIVIGETAVVGDNVSFLHEVTLGGTGKVGGDRHPKVRDGVLIGAGAKILGNVVIGECAKVAAGSVVLEDVPACTTVAGIPARVVGRCAQPSIDMDHSLPDSEEPTDESVLIWEKVN